MGSNLPQAKGIFIGYPTQRGVVCAASYEARKVRRPIRHAQHHRQAPLPGRLLRAPPRKDANREESVRIMEIISRTGATVEQMSVDEAYLNVSAACQAEDDLEYERRAGELLDPPGHNLFGPLQDREEDQLLAVDRLLYQILGHQGAFQRLGHDLVLHEQQLW